MKEIIMTGAAVILGCWIVANLLLGSSEISMQTGVKKVFTTNVERMNRIP